jgi:hypothetical protein
MIIRIAEPVVTDGGQWEPPMPIGQHRTSAACEAISFISELHDDSARLAQERARSRLITRR